MFLRYFVAALGILILSTQPIFAQRALVVSSKAFGDCPSISSVATDVGELKEAFERNGYEIFVSLPNQPGPLMPGIKRWIHELTQDSPSQPTTSILYYRGHLIQDSMGNLHLADFDCDRADPEFPLVDIVRRIAKVATAGRDYLIVLDVGYDKGNPLPELKKTVQVATRDFPNASVTMLAACQTPENTIWRQRNISHAAYWISRGLKYDRLAAGNDGTVTFTELNEFVARRISESIDLSVASTREGNEITLATHGRTTLENVASDLADQLATQALTNSVACLILPEIEVVKGSGDDKRHYATFCRQLQYRVNERLLEKCLYRAYQVAEPSVLREVLRERKFTRENIKSLKLSKLSLDYPNQTVVVYGSLYHGSKYESPRKSNELDIVLEPTFLDGRALPAIRQTATLNAPEWSTIASNSYIDRQATVDANITIAAAKYKTNPRPLAIPSDNAETASSPSDNVTTSDEELLFAEPRDRLGNRNVQLLSYEDDSIVSIADAFPDLDATVHPMRDPDYPFRIGLIVNGESQPRPPIFSADGSEMSVPLEPGDEYSIEIKNFSGRPVFMRLLVDGLNTVPDAPSAYAMPTDHRFLTLPTKLEKMRCFPAQPASIDSARSLFLRPLERTRSYKLRGFITDIRENEEQGIFRRFQVVRADQSEAWQQGFTEEVGIITAGIFQPVRRDARAMSKAPRVGTSLGETGTQVMKVYQGEFAPGPCLGVIHLRYGF